MAVKKDAQLIDELISRGVENIYPSKTFLAKKLKSGEKIRLYYGIDPTGVNLHLGHVAQLLKLKKFQELGHEVVLLFGGFTAMIGDPTDKSAARKRLTAEEVKENAKDYKKQAKQFISFTGDNKAIVENNAKWYTKMNFAKVMDLMSLVTSGQMLQRDMFQERMKNDKPIYLHELTYPLLQGYDTVMLDADGEIGGNDQTFNMLVGRDVMKAVKGKEKFVIATKLLVDPSGKKMGKTEGNMISMSDSPSDKFGKVMSWSDGMIVPAFELVTEVSMKEIKKIEKDLAAGANPRDMKMRLAEEFVAMFHGEKEATKQKEHFIAQFSKQQIPDDMPEYIMKSAATIVDVLMKTGLVTSKSEARRLINQRGVKLDSEVVDDTEFLVTPSKEGKVLQKGKRHFVRILK